MAGKLTKKELAKELGLPRSTLYYKRKLPSKDLILVERIRETLHLHPSYGYRRVATHLKINHKRALRVMKEFGVKPYRRRVHKPQRKTTDLLAGYPNLIKNCFPSSPGDIWISDFTYIPYRGRFIYLAVVEDLFSRKVVGSHISKSHDTPLVSAALFDALTYHKAPKIIHSDQGVEYRSKAYTELAKRFSISISMSKKASPWENGYQESFFSQFKVDLGDPHRFETLPELVEYIQLRVYIYNHYRIHTSLKMSPIDYLRVMQIA